jgi:hypothetical protein
VRQIATCGLLDNPSEACSNEPMSEAWGVCPSIGQLICDPAQITSTDRALFVQVYCFQLAPKILVDAGAKNQCKDRASRLTRRVTVANRTLTEIPHINTPIMLSSGPNIRQWCGSTMSP